LKLIFSFDRSSPMTMTLNNIPVTNVIKTISLSGELPNILQSSKINPRMISTQAIVFNILVLFIY